MRRRGVARLAYAREAAPGAQFPNQRQVQDPWVLGLRDAGVEFWRRRGVNVPASTVVDVADSLDVGDGAPAGGRGFARSVDPGGRLVLDGRNTGTELAWARSRRLPTRDRRRALGRLAAIVFHELGHVGGIAGHSQGGLMSPQQRPTPYDAQRLISQWIPRTAVPRRRGRGPIRGSGVDG